jgi:CheY-like chemotaxis protein
MMMTQKPLILVIDDEEALRGRCRQTLERLGYVVLTAWGQSIVNATGLSIKTDLNTRSI